MIVVYAFFHHKNSNVPKNYLVSGFEYVFFQVKYSQILKIPFGQGAF